MYPRYCIKGSYMYSQANFNRKESDTFARKPLCQIVTASSYTYPLTTRAAYDITPARVMAHNAACDVDACRCMMIVSRGYILHLILLDLLGPLRI